jgi:hypothetical protein
MYTSLVLKQPIAKVFFWDHPISRHGELFVNENVDEPMDFGDHQLRPNPGIIV